MMIIIVNTREREREREGEVCDVALQRWRCFPPHLTAFQVALATQHKLEGKKEERKREREMRN